MGCDSAFHLRQYHLHNIANYLLTFNAAFVALLYSFLDTQFFEDIFGSCLKYFGKYWILTNKDMDKVLVLWSVIKKRCQNFIKTTKNRNNKRTVQCIVCQGKNFLSIFFILHWNNFFQKWLCYPGLQSYVVLPFRQTIVSTTVRLRKSYRGFCLYISLHGDWL